MITDEAENKFSTTYAILEAYFDRFTSNTINRIIESYSENGRYQRGYHDAAFFIYAANNREDFEEIKKPFLSKDQSGIEESDGFEELQLLHDVSRNQSRQGDLYNDCARLLTSDLQAELVSIISVFFQNKINQYLQEKLPDQYKAISENFELEHGKIMESSSESESKQEELESDSSSDIDVGGKRDFSEFEEKGKNPATQIQSKRASAIQQNYQQGAYK